MHNVGMRGRVMSNERIEWVESGGGPLLLVDRSLLLDWGGGKLGEVMNDYDRACEVETPVGVIRVGDGDGLVLSVDHATTFLKLNDEAGILIRLDAVESLEGAEQFVERIRGIQAAGETFATVSFPTSSQVLFDSAFDGEWISKHIPIEIDLVPGIYAVTTRRFEPNPEYDMILHHLKKVGDCA